MSAKSRRSPLARTLDPATAQALKAQFKGVPDALVADGLPDHDPVEFTAPTTHKLGSAFKAKPGLLASLRRTLPRC